MEDFECEEYRTLIRIQHDCYEAYDAARVAEEEAVERYLGICSAANRNKLAEKREAVRRTHREWFVSMQKRVQYMERHCGASLVL